MPDELFYFLERCQCGSLLNLLKSSPQFQHTGFPIDLIRYYASSIACALAFLHGRKIAYRNLQLENVMLDASGCVKLVNFSNAKLIPYTLFEDIDDEEAVEAAAVTAATATAVDDNKDTITVSDVLFRKKKRKAFHYFKSYTICGSPEYLAPEIVMHTGHDHTADLWAFGVLLYEMVCTYTPFLPLSARGQSAEVVVQQTAFIMSNIVQMQNVVMHDYSDITHVSKTLSDLISKLLRFQPTSRLGSAYGSTGLILAHPFFDGFNSKKLHSGKLLPPYVPPLLSDDESSIVDMVSHNFLGLPKLTAYTGDPNLFKDF